MIRRVVALSIALIAVVVLSACMVPRPPGDSPLRYRDSVFTQVDVTRDLQYGSATAQNGTATALKLDLYQPRGDTQTKRPALVWVHGGGFSGGDKAGAADADVSTTFAKLGYVVVSINYRLITTACGGGNIPPACFTAAIDAQHDAQAAVRWLRKNAATYRLDATRIGIAGASAGAVTATEVGLRPDDPGESGNPGFSSAVGGFVSIAGGLPNGVFASPGDAPGLLFHGDADGVVPFAWSAQTAAAMLNARVPAFIQPLAGAGHVDYTRYRARYLEQSDYFLYTFLDLSRAQGQPVAAARAFARRAQRLRGRFERYVPRLQELRRGYERFGAP
jgi:para-nitrobenzyl esterase